MPRKRAKTPKKKKNKRKKKKKTGQAQYFRDLANMGMILYINIYNLTTRLI